MTQVGFFENARASTRALMGVGVHNGLTGRLAELAGFDVLWLSGLEVSSAKGLPDINLVSGAEMASALREVKAVSTCPILVDADNGYGSDEAALRAAHEFAAAGATAVVIEDSAYPKRNSFISASDHALMEVDSFAARVARVKSADLEVVARTEALVHGQDAVEMLHRCEAYVEAGADALFVQCTARTVDTFLDALPGVARLAPVVIAPTMAPNQSVPELRAVGADVVIFANVVMRSIALTVRRTLAELHGAERLQEVAERLISLDDLFALTKLGDWLTTSEASADG